MYEIGKHGPTHTNARDLCHTQILKVLSWMKLGNTNRLLQQLEHNDNKQLDLEQRQLDAKRPASTAIVKALWIAYNYCH